MAGSVTTVALITRLPEKVTASGSPVRNAEALPLTWMVAWEVVTVTPTGSATTGSFAVSCAWVGATARTRTASIASERMPNARLCFFIVCSSERRRQNLGRRNERDALRRGDRRRQRPQERRALAADLPPHQHGVVLVGGVVAVLHEHAAPIAELHLDGDGAAGPQTVHILAASLPG